MANINEQVVVYKDELYVKGIGGVKNLQDLKDKKSLQKVVNGGGGYTPPAGGIPKTDLSSEVQTSLNKADNAVPTAITTTWSELKALRDNSKLIPGCWYRITDYECTTSQEKTRSAGHPFDILVLATSVNTLSEEARAIQSERDKELQSIYSNSELTTYLRCPEADGDFENEHYYAFAEESYYIYTKSLTEIPNNNNVTVFYNNREHYVKITEAVFSNSYRNEGETLGSYTGLYFSKCNLNAWKIWYCLDNDTNRFAWASSDLDGAVYDNIINPYIPNFNKIINGVLYYAFNYMQVIYSDKRYPMDGDTLYVYDYEEGELIEYGTFGDYNYGGKGVIYRMIDENNNDCPYDFKNIMYYEPVDNLGMYDPNSSNYEYCYTFNFYGGVSRDYTIYNLGRNYIINNYIGPYSVNADGFPKCYLPHIIRFNYDEGDGYIENIIIKENCHDIVLGPYSTSIHIGCKCYNIILGEYSKRVTIDSECHDISVVNLDDDVYFGLQDSYIGSNCHYLKLETSDNLYNIKVMSNVGGTKNNPFVVRTLVLTAEYVQCIGKTTIGNIRIWNPADPSGT